MSKLIVDTLESTDGLSSATIAGINVATSISAQVDTNTADIATNASNISTNTSNISTNTTDIANLFYQTDVVTLGNQFTGGTQLRCTRIGNQVTLTTIGAAEHTSLSGVFSTDSVIPAIYRPDAPGFSWHLMMFFGRDGFIQTRVADNGTFIVNYMDLGGVLILRDTSDVPITVTYSVA